MTDLTDRMRTCAAYIMATRTLCEPNALIDDAADLLIEASNTLESYEPNTPMEVMTPWVENPLPSREPMEIIEPAHTPIPPTIDRNPSDLWIAPGGPLPGLKQSGTISPRACPKCDSRAGKRVSRQGNRLMLVCPVCSHVWPYAKKPLAEGPGAAE